jgi:hypothetical protein
MKQSDSTTSAPTTPITPLVMDDIQAAEYLSISPHTLRKWRCTGTGPAYVCVGRLKKYRLADLVAYAQNQLVCR